MAQRQRLYEILIRYHPDGRVGAHRMDIVEIADDTGAVIAARELPPVALAVEDLDGLMSSSNAALLAGISVATAERQFAFDERDAAKVEAQAAIQARTEALKVTNTLTTQWQADQSRIAELEAQLAALNGAGNG